MFFGEPKWLPAVDLRQGKSNLIDADMIEAEIPHLRRYARALVREREAADDLVQDALERAWRKRFLWRPSGRLRSWLFRILYRLYLDRRPRLLRAHHNLIALDDIRVQLSGHMASHSMSLHCQDVLRAIDELSKEHRAILLLVAMEQPGYQEGAHMLGIPVGTYRSRLSRARKCLDDRLVADATPVADPEAGDG